MAEHINKGKEAAEDMQTKYLERLSKICKREAQDSASTCCSHNEKRRRSSGGDTMAYLRENSEKDFQL